MGTLRRRSAYTLAIVAGLAALWLAVARCRAEPRSAVADALMLHGAGVNIDSVALWSGNTTEDARLFVTAQNNHLVEIWRLPFAGAEQPPLRFAAGLTINGVAVDNQADRLYVTSGVEGTGRFQVHVFALPTLAPLYRFGLGVLGEGETNLAILHHKNGETRVFVTDDHTVYIFRADAESATLIGKFKPPVGSIETVMADDYTQLVYVPEEKRRPGSRGGVHVFDADGVAHAQNGSSVFGSAGQFQADAEGIALYRCRDPRGRDLGTGLIIVADQRSRRTDFELFDRKTWKHVRTINIASVAGTDGIAVLDTPLPGYPDGVFAAVHADKATAVVDWRKISAALGFDCATLR